MAKEDEFVEFLEAKDLCVDNLKSLQSALIQCVDEKRIDMEDDLYNQTLVYLDGAPLLESWDELESLVFQAKGLEAEIDAWLSLHELTSYSLSWPTKKLRDTASE